MNDDEDRTASLMTPAKLAQLPAQPRAPVSGAAWLDRMATDAGHEHIARIGQLHVELQKQALGRDFAPLAAGLSALSRSLPQLDFGLLQQKGLIARLSGKSKTSGAEFAAACERIESDIDSLTTQAKALRARQAEQAGSTDKAMLEFEVEFRALEKIIDQGARWLQDMRNQLKVREADGSDAESVRQDGQRCELLVTRLKLLRAISSAAHQCQQQAQAAAERRAGMVSALQGALGGRAKQWQDRLAPLASAGREGEAPSLSLEGPMDCHRDLQLTVKELMADCAQLLLHEKTLSESLDALGSQLQSALA
jgi:hypothetical protein